jgi:hypothetical protein
MNIVLWIVAGLAAAAFLFAGSFKLAQGKKVEDKGMRWASLFSDASIRAIGAAEVLGALGLILPAVTGIAPWLTLAAAAGLVILSVGAIIAHNKVKDPSQASLPIGVLGLLAALVFVGRLVLEPFGA